MDKSAIKNFAVGARVKLIEQIGQKAYTFGISNNEIKEVEIFEDTFEINGNKYNKRLLKYRQSLEEKINDKGFDQVIEEVAYTWFNRLIAIRFMEVNEYLPSGVRVLSSTDAIKIEPDIIREAANLDFENLNIDLIYKLQDDNNTEGLFKYLLIKQCNELGKLMPAVFEEIEDFTELLLPDNLLQEGSILRNLVTSINEDDWKQKVEIIGWLYQYYNTKNNELVYDGTMKRNRIPKELLPAATQIFTPDWVVGYMVQNSLGKLALESLDLDVSIKNNWKYFIDNVVISKGKPINVEEIKIIDPAMGSGHMLVYAFDVLIDMYRNCGYTDRDASKLILEKNLYGLDIDDRAYQLAYFAVIMKAREYNKRILNQPIRTQLYSIQESNKLNSDLIEFVSREDTNITADLKYLVEIFTDAKEYGSIINVDKVDFKIIFNRINSIESEYSEDFFDIILRDEMIKKLLPIVEQAKLMSQKYDVVITNPPYLNNSRMSVKLSEFATKNYPNTKTDFSMIFYQKSINDYCKKDGFIAFVTTTSWMLLKSFEAIRKKAIEELEFESLVDFGTELFDGKVGHNPIVAWVNKNCEPTKKMTAICLTEYCYSRREEKKLQFLNKENMYVTSQRDFKKIPGMPIAYKASKYIKQIFENSPSLMSMSNPKQGLATADNNRFLRLWYEVANNKVGYMIENREEAKISKLKWFPYNKGGAYRKWFGNTEYLINWEDDGKELFAFKGSVLRSPQYYFRECLSWSKVTSGGFSMRYIPKGFLFDVAGCSIFTSNENLLYLLGFLNSKPCKSILSVLSQTLNFEVGHIANLPIKINDNYIQEINNLVKQNINISKIDWDSYESSWNFRQHPLIKYKKDTVENSYNAWNKFTNEQFYQQKDNEEALNRIFIEIYGLKEELTYMVDEKDITVNRGNILSDVKSLISYSVGCMFGRYSIDEEGLIYAGGAWVNKWKIENKEWKIKKHVKTNDGNSAEEIWGNVTFPFDSDNVIPITDDEYFEDDILSYFVEFVKIAFTEETLEENLDYIADTLGKKGNDTSRQTIRRYFLKDFYKDHLKIYKKRPIYWLFDSGKNDGFMALTYMHRYDIGIVARVRTDYLHLLQRKYEAEVNILEINFENSASAREKTISIKKKEKIQKQILECIQYDQIIAHVANQKINIDLDDGVSVNYNKFQGVEVPQGEGRKPLKADLLAKI